MDVVGFVRLPPSPNLPLVQWASFMCSAQYPDSGYSYFIPNRKQEFFILSYMLYDLAEEDYILGLVSL